jgi:hypothetical protein
MYSELALSTVGGGGGGGGGCCCCCSLTKQFLNWYET